MKTSILYVKFTSILYPVLFCSFHKPSTVTADHNIMVGSDFIISQSSQVLMSVAMPTAHSEHCTIWKNYEMNVNGHFWFVIRVSEPFKVVRAWQLEEVRFLPRVAELDDVLSGDTISLVQRREKMGYGVTGDTYTRNLTGSGTEMLYPASNNAPVASSRCTQDRCTV